MDGRDDCEYAGDGVLGTGEREIGRGDSEGIKNLTCFLGLVCSTGVEMGLVCLAIAGGMDGFVGGVEFCEIRFYNEIRIG